MTGLAIVRAARAHFRLLWVSVSYMTHIEARKVRISVIHVGGTIRTCERKIVTSTMNWIAMARSPIEKVRREIRAKDMMTEISEIVP